MPHARLPRAWRIVRTTDIVRAFGPSTARVTTLPPDPDTVRSAGSRRRCKKPMSTGRSEQDAATARRSSFKRQSTPCDLCWCGHEHWLHIYDA